jgi:hypothetical protein
MSPAGRPRIGQAWVILSVAAMIFAVVGVIVGRIRLGVTLAAAVRLVALATAVADRHGGRRPLRRVERR